jgi:tetratricopeptide (TPR) repeat protein
MTRHLLGLTVTGCALVAVLLVTAPLGAQVPDEFTNLKIFDKNIGKQELLGYMKGWTRALGVRCNHCHVGPDNLQGMDFATDEKEHKRATRAMVEMVMAINGQYLGSWEDEHHEEEGEEHGVTCFTCHRGQPEPPEKITSILGETAMNDGADAAIAKYEELKKEYYGAGLYDFREGIFGDIAQEAVDAGKIDEANEMLRAALQLFPESADLNAFLGMGLLQAGDTAGASAAFDKALELDPQNRNAKRGKTMLERSGQ